MKIIQFLFMMMIKFKAGKYDRNKTAVFEVVKAVRLRSERDFILALKRYWSSYTLTPEEIPQ